MANKDILQNLKKLIADRAYQDALVICKDELLDNPGSFEYNLCAADSQQPIEQFE